jgi:branched-chain amino acid aminotransferase
LRNCCCSKWLDPRSFERRAHSYLSQLTPVRSITYHDSPETTKKISIGDGVNAGPGFISILTQLTGIQSGVQEDKHDWTWPQAGVDGSA